MALTAKQEWVRLNKAINCKHYIGTRSWKVIDDSFNPYTEVNEAQMRANVPSEKSVPKRLATAKKVAQ